MNPLGGRGSGFTGSLVGLFSSPTFRGVSMHLDLTYLLLRRSMMLVCIWFGLYRVLSSLFDHYIMRVKV